MASEFTHLSLFSGIGGIDLAAEWAGFESVAMVERDKYCQKILAKNFPNTKIHDDVTTFNAIEYRGKIDLLSGGFPCQPHSLAGQRKASSDERDLWDEVVRIIRDSQPKWFLGENVRGLLSSESGKFFGRILNDLESLGYRVGWCLYGAKDIGAVHRRERVFIVAYSASEQCNGDKSRFGKFTQPSTSKSRGSDNASDAADTDSKSRPQADSTTCSIGSERNSRDNACWSHWQPISTGNWREWDTCPILYETRSKSRVCRAHDGISSRVDRLRALGNAVVPQQVYPILAEIANALRDEKS